MEIIKTNVSADNKRLMFKLTHDSGEKIQTVENGAVLNVTDYLHYKDSKLMTTGEFKESVVLAIRCADGQQYHTISPTFIDSFTQIVECFGDEIPPIVVIKSRSKNNREFIDCTIE